MGLGEANSSLAEAVYEARVAPMANSSVVDEGEIMDGADYQARARSLKLPTMIMIEATKVTTSGLSLELLLRSPERERSIEAHSRSAGRLSRKLGCSPQTPF